MEIGTTAAPPAQTGCAAVRAQGASESLACSFAQQAKPGGDLMAQLQAMHPNEEGRVRLT